MAVSGHPTNQSGEVQAATFCNLVDAFEKKGLISVFSTEVRIFEDHAKYQTFGKYFDQFSFREKKILKPGAVNQIPIS